MPVEPYGSAIFIEVVHILLGDRHVLGYLQQGTRHSLAADVPIENATHGVGNRLIMVVALDENGEQTRNATAADSRSSALQEPRKLRKDSRRITPLLAGS